MNNKTSLCILYSILIGSLISAAYSTRKTELDVINDDILSNGRDVLRIYSQTTNFGPFIGKLKHQHVYKVKTDDGTYWFRFGNNSLDPEVEVDVQQIP